IVLIVGVVILDRHIAPLDIARFGQTLAEYCCQVLDRGTNIEIADHRHRRLLRARHERPRYRSAEHRDELAASHSITSSARPSNGSGTVTPSALAVLRLIINSTLVACCTGRSAGFSPLRIRPV